MNRLSHKNRDLRTTDADCWGERKRSDGNFREIPRILEIDRYTISFESRWLMKRGKQMIAFTRQLHETLVRGHGISRDGIKFDSLTTK